MNKKGSESDESTAINAFEFVKWTDVCYLISPEKKDSKEDKAVNLFDL